MPKFKKIDKEYQITDETVNCYGYRLLTSGYLMSEYQKNPIGFHMHTRDGVLVRWEDLRMDGDKVWAKPVVNLSNSRGQQTVEEIENGFLNAASVGHIVVLEVSDDPKLKLAGQTGPTVTKWFNRECSLVDIPGNYNALTNLYDKDNNPLNLADFSTPQIMSKTAIVFTAVHLAAMALPSTAEETEVQNAFNDLVAKANRAEKAEKELKDLKASTTKTRNEANLKAALEGKKITKELSDSLAVDYAENPEGLEKLLAAMPAQTLVTENLKTGAATDSPYKDLLDKEWDELFENGTIAKLKAAEDKGAYKAVFKKEFGYDPKV